MRRRVTEGEEHNRSWLQPAIWIFILTAAGCAVPLSIVPKTSSTQSAAAQRAPSQSLSQGCPVTPTTTESPPSSIAASFSLNWHKSADGRLWASQPYHWIAPGTPKVVWAKPIGTRLQVSGHRLDGEAPPLKAEVPDGYVSFGYQASTLIQN
jgi:hypothetical protein